jgi:dTDP-4-dehydrorhamnose 3,5-epimerase
MFNGQVNEISGVRIIQSLPVKDTRGTFIKCHPNKEFNSSLDSVAVSLNPIPGTIRGLHFQVEPYAEEKIVTCIQGSILDVIMDLRPSSPTHGKWISIELSATKPSHLYLPKGTAHGFQTIEPNSIVQYCLTSPYTPESSFSINPIGDLGIDWPIKNFIISDKDSDGVSISQALQKYADSLKD